MKLYWYGKWALPKDAERHARDGAMVVPNERMEENMRGVYDRGKEDSRHEVERDGIVIFAQAVREEMQQWVGTEKREGFKDSVPMWALEQLLEKWNIPAPADACELQRKDGQ